MEFHQTFYFSTYLNLLLIRKQQQQQTTKLSFTIVFLQFGQQQPQQKVLSYFYFCSLLKITENPSRDIKIKPYLFNSSISIIL